MKIPQVLVILLIISSAASWIYLAAPLRNYLYYYSALGQLNLNATQVTVQASTSNVTVGLSLMLTNPTPYEGLVFRAVGYRADVSNGTMTCTAGGFASGNCGGIVMGSGSAGLNGPTPIQPHSTLTIPVNLILTGPVRSEFQNVCRNNNNSLSWYIHTAVALGTRDGELVYSSVLPAGSTCGQ